MILVRKPHVPDRPSEAIGRRLFGNPDEAFLQSQAQAGAAHAGRGPHRWPWPRWTWGRPAWSGTSGPAAARWRSRPPRSPRRQDLRHRNGPGRPRVDHRERRAVRTSRTWSPCWAGPPTPGRDLPDPDAIFVGGSGREISRLVEPAYERLPRGGRLVATRAASRTPADTHACSAARAWRSRSG